MNTVDFSGSKAVAKTFRYNLSVHQHIGRARAAHRDTQARLVYHRSIQLASR